MFVVQTLKQNVIKSLQFLYKFDSTFTYFAHSQLFQ